jgi:hypothetical protein
LFFITYSPHTTNTPRAAPRAVTTVATGRAAVGVGALVDVGAGVGGTGAAGQVRLQPDTENETQGLGSRAQQFGPPPRVPSSLGRHVPVASHSLGSHHEQFLARVVFEARQELQLPPLNPGVPGYLSRSLQLCAGHTSTQLAMCCRAAQMRSGSRHLTPTSYWALSVHLPEVSHHVQLRGASRHERQPPPLLKSCALHGAEHDSVQFCSGIPPCG